MRGKFIAFEGNDGCGKSTQMEMLATYLKETYGITSKRFDIPYHGSKQAKLVDDYLSGSLGHLTTCQIAALYAIDQGITYTAENGINEALNRGEWVITSRWYLSNLAYRGAQDIIETEPRMVCADCYEEWQVPYIVNTQLLKEIEDLTTIFLDAGKPDIVLYMRLGEDARLNMLEKREKPEDIHENDKPFLRVVDCMYDYLYTSKKYGMEKIECGWESPLPKSDIHKLVCQKVKPLIDDYITSE